MKVLSIAKTAWSKLNPEKRFTRMLSLDALNLMRHNKLSLEKASKYVGLDKETVQQHIASAIYKRHNRWIPKRMDIIQRRMTVYKNGKSTSIVVRDSKQASRIGEYFNDVKKALTTGDDSFLRKYNRRKIIGVRGGKHKLETRLEKIREIEEAKEDGEFQVLYDTVR
ncbi:MAG: hypothetical protein HYW23_00490 [Candidatus Aenigmarchaeota archaeon]|nr:hypothetical protein [Candidatus Aenigmarchaeota archaeon]